MKSNIKLSKEVIVTFRFVGDNVDPDVITSKLGLQPSLAHAKGQVVEKHPEHIYPSGFWELRSSISADRPLEEHLEKLLDRLEPKAVLIQEIIEMDLIPNFRCGCFITGSTISVEINADMLRRIADIGASLEYHLYCDCDEDDDMKPEFN